MAWQGPLGDEMGWLRMGVVMFLVLLLFRKLAQIIFAEPKRIFASFKFERPFVIVSANAEASGGGCGDMSLDIDYVSLFRLDWSK